MKQITINYISRSISHANSLLDILINTKEDDKITLNYIKDNIIVLSKLGACYFRVNEDCTKDVLMKKINNIINYLTDTLIE